MSQSSNPNQAEIYIFQTVINFGIMKVAATPFVTFSLDTGYTGSMRVEGVLKKRKNGNSIGGFISKFNTRYFILDLVDLKFLYLENENKPLRKAKEISLKEITAVRCTFFNYTKEQGVWAFPFHVITHQRIYLLIARDKIFYNNLIRAFQHLINNVTKQSLFDSKSLRDFHVDGEKSKKPLPTVTRTQLSLSPKNRGNEQITTFTEPVELQEAVVYRRNSPITARIEEIQSSGNKGRFKSPIVFKIKSLSEARYQTPIANENNSDSTMNVPERSRKIAESRIDDNVLGVKIRSERAGTHVEQPNYQKIRSLRKLRQNEIGEERGEFGFFKREISDEENRAPNDLHEDIIQELRMKTLDMTIPEKTGYSSNAKRVVANFREKNDDIIIEKAEMYEDWDREFA